MSAKLAGHMDGRFLFWNQLPNFCNEHDFHIGVHAEEAVIHSGYVRLGEKSVGSNSCQAE